MNTTSITIQITFLSHVQRFKSHDKYKNIVPCAIALTTKKMCRDHDDIRIDFIIAKVAKVVLLYIIFKVCAVIQKTCQCEVVRCD